METGKKSPEPNHPFQGFQDYSVPLIILSKVFGKIQQGIWENII